MTTVSIMLVAVFCLVLSMEVLEAKPTHKKNEAAGGLCAGIAVYQVTMETFWTKTNFPKQFPAYRPQAQWSKLIGRTHDMQYTLWSEGELATEAVKQFSEKSLTTALDNDTQGMMGVFDDFVGPIIPSGEGVSVVNAYMQGQHSKLSLIVRMIPSPDWFVGVDSLDLCDSTGRWTSDHTVDLHPTDAGTDRGMTFSAPDWAESPPRPIARITAKFPNHPANSFFYPELENLPIIARLTVKKIELEDAEELNDVNEQKRELKPAARSINAMSKLNEMKQRSAALNTAAKSRVESNGKQAAAATRGVRLDCEVTEWTEWSDCSKTCGFGVRTRTRTVTQQAQAGGHVCPPLKDNQMCGSMRGCDYKPFSANNWNSGSSSSSKDSAAAAAAKI